MSEHGPHTSSSPADSRAQHFQPLSHIFISSPIMDVLEPSKHDREEIHSSKRRQRSQTVPAFEPSNQRQRIRKPIRLLPPVPITSSSRPTSSQGLKRLRSRPRRPLPSLPFTPQSPPTPSYETRRRARPKISITTTLRPPTPTTPLSPSMPQLPTPRTAKRKQISKLSKILGENVPYEMVFRDSSGCVDLAQMIEVMQLDPKKMGGAGGWEVMKNGKAPSYPRLFQKTPQISETILKDGEDKIDNSGMELLLPDLPRVRKESMASQLSRKWMRERDGRRWVENDFEGVLQTLRKL
jgi:hypothetical protein